MSSPDSKTAVFFGGVVPAGPGEERIAFEVGAALGAAGYRLLHGGYNGLMEHAARGASTSGASVTAVTFAGMQWGDFNPYVTQVIKAPDLGVRLNTFLDDADLVVAMGGGVGTLHELTAAIWYAGNVRQIPVWLVGPTATALHRFLTEHGWLVETPTRPLGFLHAVDDQAGLTAGLSVDAAESGGVS